MSSDEVDFEAAKPLSSTEKMVKHFSAEPAEKHVKAAEAEVAPLVEDFGQLSYKELCPELAEQYFKICSEFERLEGIKQALRAEILRLAGPGEGKKWSAHLGKRTLNFTKRAGAAKVDYDRYIKDQIGEKAVKEIAAMKDAAKLGVESVYVKVADDSISVEVR